MAGTSSTTLVGLGALTLLAAFGGYTASFACLVLERRAHGLAATGRSSCVCGAPIPMYRNIPMLSWLLQRGRAACCGARIPTWYVVAEFATAIAAAGGALVIDSAPLGAALAGILLAVVLTAVYLRLCSSPHQMVSATSEGDD